MTARTMVMRVSATVAVTVMVRASECKHSDLKRVSTSLMYVLSSRARQPRCHRSYFCDLIPIPDAGYLLLLLINARMVL